MKTIKSLCILAAFAMLPLTSTYAQKANVKKTYSKIVLPRDLNLEKVKVNESVSLYAPKMAAKSTASAEVSFTVKSLSQKGITPSQISVYNKDFKYVDYMNGNDEKKITVPEGTYDMFISYSGKTTYYVFKEDITVKDGEVYIFNQEDAKNDITFKFYDENNKELFMDIYDGSKLVEKGTAESMSKVTSFMHKDYGMTGMIISLGYMPMNYQMEFFVNDLSNDYIVAHGTNINANGTTYTYKYGCTKIEPGMRQNFNGDDLVKCVTTVNVNDLMNGDPNALVPGYNFTLLYDGLSIAGEKGFALKGTSQDKKVTNFMYCPESDVNSSDKVNVIFAPILSNYYEVVEDEYGKYTNYYGTICCAMLGDKNGIKYINAGADIDWGGFNVPEGLVDTKYYPGHPEFSFESADGTMTFGNNCPVTSFRALRYDNNGYVEGWDTHFFTGRYGELYEGEAYVADFYEEIESDGTTKTTINTPLIKVDGLEGYNKTEVHFDLNKPDFSAPTIQMLTFKNEAGEITDRLDKCEGSKLIMTGGDFKYHMNYETYIGYFTCDDATVEISYSPYGQNLWKNIAINEIPEKKFMPYFGNFYEAALDNIECTENNQWFDLKIVIKDETGNYQSQIVSPAFKIISNVETGITDIEKNKSELTYNAGMIKYTGIAKFEVRTLAGAVIRTANGSEISVKNLPAGAYIVIAKTSADGTLTKKILIE